ncbi:hypothetical protein A4X17_05950 [Plantibacter sp. H53]|nr:hypothetical protein A4X17_05950 [Plantibacter sp. H53]
MLPPSTEPYPATLDEVYDRFVAEAPFAAERERVFTALKLYAELVWDLFPDARLRIDGGFTTHKDWAAPHDADVVVLCPTYTDEQVSQGIEAPLFTFLNAEGTLLGQRVSIGKAHVMGGLIDGFFVPADVVEVREFFEDYWSAVTDRDKQVVPGLRKGYVEVINPDVSV